MQNYSNKKNVLIIGDNRTLQDSKLYDTNKQTTLEKSNYLVNRVIQELPKDIETAVIDYRRIDKKTLDRIAKEDSHVIIHADQTYRDELLSRISNTLVDQGLTVWNGKLHDISKRKVDAVAQELGLQPLGVEKGYEGKVFMKTDFNAGDVPSDLSDFQYKILDSSQVPSQLWDDSRMFISEFVDPSLHSDSNYGRVERVYFSGDEYFVISIYGRDKSEIKSDKVMRLYYRPLHKRESDLDFLVQEGISKPGFSLGFVDAYQEQAYQTTKNIQERLGIDVGVIEYLIDPKTDALRLMDVNYTSYNSSVGDTFTKIFANDLYTRLDR
jgi:hypothetical protein